MIDRLIELIRKEGLDINSFFLLYEMVTNKGLITQYDVHTLISLQDLKLVKITDWNNAGGDIRQKGIDLIDNIVKELDTKQGVKFDDLIKVDTEDISQWIGDYRELFKGTKVGARGDKKSCLEKMQRFFKVYPEYADKDIIFRATENYINSEAMNNNYKYLQRADYFIFKKLEKEETSRLASFCDEANEKVNEGFTKML